MHCNMPILGRRKAGRSLLYSCIDSACVTKGRSPHQAGRPFGWVWRVTSARACSQSVSLYPGHTATARTCACILGTRRRPLGP